MNNRTHINNELQSIAPGLISIPATMPYTLPPGYFSELDSRISSFLKNGEVHSELLFTISKTIPYTIPEGYFEQLPDAILQKLRTLSLGNEVEFWNQMPKSTPYTLPVGFFENFPAIVLQKIKKTEQPQVVPTGYFESLPDTLLAKVRKLNADKELQEVAPLLNTISKQPVHHIPVGYFDSLDALSIAHGFNRGLKETAPVVNIRKKSNWLKYAVAASVVFVLGFGAWSLFSKKSNTLPSIVNQPTVTVINQELANLDAATIENYLKTNNAVAQTDLPVGGVEELNNADLDELLKGFTDQQLKKHIEETPELPGAKNLKSHT